MVIFGSTIALKVLEGLIISNNSSKLSLSNGDGVIDNESTDFAEKDDSFFLDRLPRLPTRVLSVFLPK